MNSQKSWGISIRGRIILFVKDSGQATTQQIIKACGKEASGQLKTLVENGELVRVKRGVYEFREVTVGFRI